MWRFSDGLFQAWLAQHAHRPLAGVELAGRQLQQRRFAGAVGAEQAGNAGRDAQGQLVDADDVAVPLGNLVELNDRRSLQPIQRPDAEVQNACGKSEKNGQHAGRPVPGILRSSQCSQELVPHFDRLQIAHVLQASSVRAAARRCATGWRCTKPAAASWSGPPRVSSARNSSCTLLTALAGPFAARVCCSRRQRLLARRRPHLGRLHRVLLSVHVHGGVARVSTASRMLPTIVLTNHSPTQKRATYRELRDSDDNASISVPGGHDDDRPVSQTGNQQREGVPHDRNVQAEEPSRST